MLWRSRRAAAAVILAGVFGVGVMARDQSAPGILLQPAHIDAALRQRADIAIRESVDRYSEWLGPPPASLPTIAVERSWGDAPSAMTVEIHVAYEIARSWMSSDPAPAINGIAWYLQGRIVERLFDYRYHQAGHSAAAVWFFGRMVARDVPQLRMARDTAGVGRYWRGSAWPDVTPPLPASVDRHAQRMAMALGSIEHLLGWPVVQGAIFEVRRQLGSGAASDEDVAGALSAAMGIDVAPFLAASQRTEPVDYAITSVTAGAVSVARTGARAPQAMTLRVEFANGEQVNARWDGVAAHTFEFESSSAIASAHLDPERVALLDVDRLNNDWRATPSVNTPVGKWIARWVVWLEDAVLTYSAAL